jgi:hypothetical protein
LENVKVAFVATGNLLNDGAEAIGPGWIVGAGAGSLTGYEIENHFAHISQRGTDQSEIATLAHNDQVIAGVGGIAAQRAVEKNEKHIATIRSQEPRPPSGAESAVALGGGFVLGAVATVVLAGSASRHLRQRRLVKTPLSS